MREQAGDLTSAEALYRQAARHGDTDALVDVDRLRALAADTAAVVDLARLRKLAGDLTNAEALYRQAADHGDTDALVALSQVRLEAGDDAGAGVLLDEAMSRLGAVIRSLTRKHARNMSDFGQKPASHPETDALMSQAEQCEYAGDLSDAETLYQQAADRGNPDALVPSCATRPVIFLVPKLCTSRPPTAATSLRSCT